MTGLLKPFGIEPEILAKKGAIDDMAYCQFHKNGKGRKDWKFSSQQTRCHASIAVVYSEEVGATQWVSLSEHEVRWREQGNALIELHCGRSEPPEHPDVALVTPSEKRAPSPHQIWPTW